MNRKVIYRDETDIGLFSKKELDVLKEKNRLIFLEEMKKVRSLQIIIGELRK